GLFDALERGDGAAAALDGAAALDLEPRVQAVRTLEKGLSLDVKLLAVALESQIADRVRSAEREESRTIALIIVYSLLATAVALSALVISQRLLVPIRKLTEGVKAVAAGV